MNLNSQNLKSTNFLNTIDNENNFNSDEEDPDEINFDILFNNNNDQSLSPNKNQTLSNENSSKKREKNFGKNSENSPDLKINKINKIQTHNTNISFFDQMKNTSNNNISAINFNLDNTYNYNNNPNDPNENENENFVNKYLLDDLTKVENYLIIISQSCEKNPKIFPPNTFIHSLNKVTFKDCIISNEKFDFEIIPPQEFHLVSKYIFLNINKYITDILDHFKSQRRRVFDDSEKLTEEYLGVIKNFQQKKSEILNFVFKEFSSKLNYTAKSFMNNFMFYISFFKLNGIENYGNFNNNNGLEVFNRFFNQKIFEKFCDFVRSNKIHDKVNIDKELQKTICQNLMGFNFIGIKE